MESNNQKSFFPSRKNSLIIDLDTLIWNDVQLTSWYGSKFGPTFNQLMCDYLNPFKGKSEYEELVDYYKTLEYSREEDYEDYMYSQYLDIDEDNELESTYDYDRDDHQSGSDSESEDDEYWIDY